MGQVRDDSLRVTRWDEFVGQGKTRERLRVHMQAAQARNRPLEHTLLTGPPGYGKTTLAALIASGLAEPFESYTMPLDERWFANHLLRYSGGVILLDEIHRATRRQQETLLPLLEDGYIQVARGRRIHVEWLTIIAATTERDKIIAPLYDRFPIKPEFEPYSVEDMAKIVAGFAKRGGVTLAKSVATALGRAAGGIPRNARQLVLAARDLGITTGRAATTDEILALCQTDPDGLTAQHNAYLRTVEKMGGSVGLDQLASMLQLDKSVIRQLERLLLDLELVEFTRTGRELTGAGFKRARASQSRQAA